MRISKISLISLVVLAAVFGIFVFGAKAACGAEFYQFPSVGDSPFEQGLFLHTCIAGASLSANPSSGGAPLNGVDLNLSLSGTVSGQTYTCRFDCTNDGVWESSVSCGYTGYNAVDVCNYSSAGTYTAKGRWEYPAGTFRAESTTGISVSACIPPSSGNWNIVQSCSISGTVTVTSGNINFTGAYTLTMNAGAIVRFPAGYQIILGSGTLAVASTAQIQQY